MPNRQRQWIEADGPLADVIDLLEWLSFSPTPDQICQQVVVDSLRGFGAVRSRLSILSSDDALNMIGCYGFEINCTGQRQEASVWRARKDDVMEIRTNEEFVGFNKSGTTFAAEIREMGTSKGALIVWFTAPVKDREAVLELMASLIKPISLYICQTQRALLAPALLFKQREVNVSRSDFSARQFQIVQGMVEGKTNHELASDLGYSVSTIRHETMRIFQVLGVSDRKEAARSAIDHGIC